MTESAEQSWRDKYVELIKKIDEQEKSTLAYEALIHRFINKLAIIVQDVEPLLDAKLTQLRQLIDQPDSYEEVRSCLESMTDDFRAAELGTQEKIQDFKNNMLTIKALFDHMALPKETVDLLSNLQQDIKSSAASSDQTHLVNLLAQICHDLNRRIELKQLSLFPPHSLLKKLKSFFTGKDLEPLEDLVLPEFLQEQFARMIDKLGVSKDLMQQAKALYEVIEYGLTIRQLPSFIAELTDLVVEVAHSDDEKLDQFCHNFKDQVADSRHFFGDLQGAISNQGADINELQQAIQTQFKKITSEVYQKTPTEIVAQLDKRLKHMVGTVNIYHDKSEQELQNALKNIKQLQQQLEDSELQINALNQHLAEKRFGVQMDILTDLPNRQAYEDWIVRELQRFTRYHRPFSLLLGDIDHFSKFNKTYSSEAGDRAVAGCAKLLRSKLRATDFIARYSGGCFIMVLPETDVETGLEVTENLRRAIERAPFKWKEEQVDITMSFGVTQVCKSDEVSLLHERLEQALRMAKDQGLNSIMKL